MNGTFIGRTAELTALSTALGEQRLVTLSGVGGVGKTRLAARAAHARRADHPDGIHIVELSPLQDPALLAITIAENVRLADQTTRLQTEVLCEWLADKRLLLVLDTCEHLLGACGELAELMLDAAPGLTVLVTSRQPLGRDAEHVLPLRPLSLPAPGSTDPDASDALALLRDRAEAAAPGRRLTERYAAESAELCRRLDGIPLAIELAAARLNAFTVPDLLARLHARFEVLTADSRTPRRHRTLRTTIGWSHELCEPLERLLWARLSVFRGGWTPEAARAVCSGGPLPESRIESVLRGLAEKSVVQCERSAEPPRYRMLDTLREYGAQWLAELGETTAVRDRHAAYFRDLAKAGDVACMGASQVAWHRRLHAEHANLRAVLDFLLARGDGRAALEVAGALWFFWFGCGRQREGRGHLRRALELVPEDCPERTKGLWSHGTLALIQGDLEVAAVAGRKFAEAVAGQDHPDTRHAVTYLVGGTHCLKGNQRAAYEVLDAAPRSPGDGGSYPAAWLLTRLLRHFVQLQCGQFAEAAADAAVTRAECERRGELWVRCFAGYMQATAELGMADIGSALAHAREALAGMRILEDSLCTAMILDVLAAALAAAGSGPAGARLLGVADAIWLTVGRRQFGAPELSAARADCERRLREALGDTAYEKEFRRGLEAGAEDGVAYALGEPALLASGD
ncbi:ATP-binding protein [Streptomyces niger]|uniref:ATP-binding protein n=1 Tax=Streptomyces niger TaxID=66373 RepID=UPI00069C7376|nr:NB-ARC domain-containing protein [Streptomyces niger]